MAGEIDWRYHGWFRWAPRDVWRKVASANDLEQCWQMMETYAIGRKGLYSMVVLPSNESPFTLKRGRKRND